jgi:hypothetical protein
MEKQEARIKCTGCGSSYKLKVPVTDKPVNFKCKKCGKILKVRVTSARDAQASAPPPPPPPPPAAEFDGAIPGLETTQLPDTDDFFDPDSVGSPTPGAQGSGIHNEPAGGDFQLDDRMPLFTTDRAPDPTVRIQPSMDETVRIQEPVFEQGYVDQLQAQPKAVNKAGAPEPEKPRGSERRWLALDDEQVKGPFTDSEVVSMIHDGEIDAETPLRMGQRPWIKASQVADFKHCFSKEKPIRTDAGRIDVRQGPARRDDSAEPQSKEAPFYKDFAAIAPYPLGNGKWQPIVIFSGIAFALCTILSLDFLIGLPLSVAGWILLYGYLTTLMHNTQKAPKAPPPPWDFSHVKDMAQDGLRVFLVLLLFSLIPVTVCLLVMITCFLNDMDLFGYLSLAATVVVFAGSLFVTPAALVIQDTRRSLAASLHPANILKLIREGRTAYKMLAVTSIAAGLLSMVVVLLAVFLVDIPLAGFVVSGLLMALVLSYANFVWFHVLGRFSRENSALTLQAVTEVKA